MKDFKKVVILCISGVLLISVFTLSGCAVLFPKVFGERRDRGNDCSEVDSVWCDYYCDGTADDWVACSQCFDYACHDDDNDGC